MRYRPLGRTGQYVSEICLGAMTFDGGAGFWRAIGALDQAASTKLVGRALEAGVNFIDIANVYSEGQSEVQVGQSLRDLGVKREDVIVATKVRGRMGQGPNSVGLSRGHIMDQIAGSLKRLGLDHVDLYQIHGFDPVTPLEETLRALDDCVSRGYVRTIGCSNLAAWQIMKALGISERRGFARFETVQAYYTIAGRDLEREILPLVEDQGLGVMVWSPLAGGLLSGKFNRDGGKPNDARRRFSAGREGARVRHRRCDAADRAGARRLGRSRGARLAARPQGRDERDHRGQDARATRRQSRRGQARAERWGNRRTRSRQRAEPGISGLDDRAPIRPEIAAAQRLNAASE